MNIIYMISFILVFAGVLLIPVQKGKSNFLARASICMVASLGFNILLSILLYALHIHVSLLLLSILNVIIAICIGIVIYTKKEIQKYTIGKHDIICILLMLLVVTSFAVVCYGLPMNIKYGSTDASTHFSAAYDYMDKGKILLSENDGIASAFGYDNLMIGSYVNEGIFFALFPIDSLSMYQLYIIFDLCMLVLSGIMMYVCMNQLLKKQSIISIIIATIYVLGYPLNSVIMGCAYLTLSLLFVTAILYVFSIKDQISGRYFGILLFLLNIGLLHTYTLFIVIVFAAEGVALLVSCKRKSWIYILFSLILVLPTALIYFTDVTDKMSIVSVEGPMYKNYLSNFILFVPFVIYGIVQDLKNKKYVSFSNVLFCILVVSIPLLFVLKENGIFSSYYVFKFYYLLWTAVLFLTGKGIMYLYTKRKYYGVFATFILVAILGLSYPFIATKYTDEQLMTDKIIEPPYYFAEIFKINADFMMNKSFILNQEELVLVAEYAKYDHHDITVLGSWSQAHWTYALTHQLEKENNISLKLLQEGDVNFIKTNYLLGFKRATIMHLFQQEIMSKYQYVYENQYGGVLKKVE